MNAFEIVTSRVAVLASLGFALPTLACTAKSGDSKSDEVVATAAELEAGTSANSLQLARVAKQLEDGELADVEALEIMINDPESELSAVDIDEDGVIDFVQVVEEKQGDETVLVLRAIPSSKKGADVDTIAVEVARIELQLAEPAKQDEQATIVVHATYSDHIHHDPEIHVYHHETTVVLVEGHFFHHVFVVEHGPYHGHGEVVVEIHHDHRHKSHRKHKKHKKGKGRGKAKGHGKHGKHVVVTW